MLGNVVRLERNTPAHGPARRRLGEEAPLASQLDVSYIADTVVLFRMSETEGRRRKVLTVYKRRAGAHDQTIRELVLDPGGVSVGEKLSANVVFRPPRDGIGDVLGGDRER